MIDIRRTRAVAAGGILVLVTLRAAGGQPAAESIQRLGIVPQPVTVTPARGVFRLGPGTVIWADAATIAVARSLARAVEPATGFDLAVRSGAGSSGNRIVIRRDRSLARTLGAEGYRLEVHPGRVTIVAPEAAGAFYATQTLRQLLLPAIYREAPIEGVAWTIPAVTIEDRPRFAWRGMHLDVSRHFMPKEFVKKYIDLLALHKMNTFHWHLTDDQGWRIEIKKYPLLTQVGAWRKETLVGRPNRDTLLNVFDKKPHGGFYTQDDVREVVAYAKARFVTVVPEIEMPGHAQAAIAAYPWLGNLPDSLGVWTGWGVTPHIFNPSDSTIAFLKDVLTEVLQLFPSKFIHVGGDEAIKPEWVASPVAQARIRALGLKDEHELQSWFIRQMDAFLAARGRRLVGWDEILEGGLAENAVVMSWRGITGGLAAARAAHDVVMTPTRNTYFDYYQSADREREPLSIGGFLPIDTVYAFEPVPPELEPQFARHILGAQAQLWTEYIEGPKHAEYMVFPRAAALAEVVWTPPERKNFADFMARLDVHLRRLDALDVNSRRPK
jgi:hexosaminidase